MSDIVIIKSARNLIRQSWQRLKSIDYKDVAIGAWIITCAFLCLWFCYKIGALAYELATDAPVVTIVSITAVVIAKLYFNYKTKAGQ